MVLFNRLPREQISQIVRIEVGRVSERLSEQALALSVTEAAVEWLADAGYDPAYGARPVGRAVRQHLLNPLARALIGQEGEAEGRGVAIEVDHVPPDATLTIQISGHGGGSSGATESD